jgi:arsenate reductase
MSEPEKQSVLLVCTGNACRSQMAEALWRAQAGDRFEVCSAGTFPAGVHPLARQVIEELGIDMSGHSSKSVYAMFDRSFDLVITVCDSAKEICPIFPRAARQLHWPFADPIEAVGSVEQRLAEFRRTRDQILARIRQFLQEDGKADSSPPPTSSTTPP